MNDNFFLSVEMFMLGWVCLVFGTAIILVGYELIKYLTKKKKILLNWIKQALHKYDYGEK